MRSHIFLLCVTLLSAVGSLRAEFQFTDPNWAVEIKLEAKPATDSVVTPSPQGNVHATRYFLERAGEHYLLVHFSYPLALTPGDEIPLYEKSVKDFMKSRPGKMKESDTFAFGPYNGYRFVIEQPRERTLREIRLLIVGSSLYVVSAEVPAVDKSGGLARAAKFFASMTVHPNFGDRRAVDERERWREVSSGNFSLRYDAARWYRDPSDNEGGIFNFLRADEKAEAQFIAEDHPVEGGNIEEAVLQTAREGADRLEVKKRGKKMRGMVQVSELDFTAHIEKTAYRNRGYFYSGSEGSVQLRAWATTPNFPAVEIEMEELLDGLRISARTPSR